MQAVRRGQVQRRSTTRQHPARSLRRPVATVRRARALAGGTVALARIAAVRSQMVSAWLAGRKPVSPKAAVAIELALGVPARQLCALVPWDALPADAALRGVVRDSSDG